MSFNDQTLTCRDCGQDFIWTAGEQAFYQTRGLTNQPRRCPSCRQARKSTSGGGSYGGSSMGFSGGGGGGGGGYERAPRQMYAAVCDNCGKSTEVPFQPTTGKPVYCSDCFRERRASMGSYGGGSGGGGSYGSRY